MHVTAKADYAVRAVIELAGSKQSSPRKVDEVAQAQGIPVSFLENILTQPLALGALGGEHARRGQAHGQYLTLAQFELLGAAAGDLRPQLATIRERELDAHLEAQVHDALHERLGGTVAAFREDLDVVRAQ